MNLFIFLFYFYYHRIQLQDLVRRGSTPEDQVIIDDKRDSLVAMFAQLKDLQTLAGIIENTGKEKPILDDETKYDEYEDESLAPTVNEISSSIERKVIILPSNGNVERSETNVSDLEISFRTRQADSQLIQLRDLIADISFQFSHVIRGQIRKNIRSRSQKRIKSLHNQLSLHARIYTRCRNHLVALKCDQSILGRFRILKKDDLKSSTAILDPNQSGSSSIKLSWIWHSSRWLLLNVNTLDGVNRNSVINSGSNSSSGAILGPDTVSVSESNFTSGALPGPDPVSLYECMFLWVIFLVFWVLLWLQLNGFTTSEQGL